MSQGASMPLEIHHELGQPVALNLPESFNAAVAPRADEQPPTLGLFIGGEWKQARRGELFDVISPIDGSLIARAQKAVPEDIEEAIGAARDARRDFKAMPASERLDICRRAAEAMEELHGAFVDAIVADLGKTPDQAHSEVSSTV